ncbi:uncharacterized protein LOC131880649 [Tigriopus californicus]|uniref:uncharacterized protein LOC131880649 n=1 Tax=Tigriopus californicus TaxID=6832 RepID=UPI0027DA7526|nr:uncharacterized protein LOC131880649 [Tigriopus californicus]
MDVFWMWIVVVLLQALLIVICFSLSVLMKCLLDRPGGALPTHHRHRPRRGNGNNNTNQSGQQSTIQGDSISVISSSSGCALPPPYEEVCEIDLDALPKYEDISQLNLKGQKPIMSV